MLNGSTLTRVLEYGSPTAGQRVLENLKRGSSESQYSLLGRLSSSDVELDHDGPLLQGRDHLP